jgi:microcystin-dependent protein
MADPFIGEIKMAGFNFAPANWALCNGQLLSINQNAALYALIGNTYGGDGQTTFALPNFQGRVPVHQGQAVPNGHAYGLGEIGGSENVSLTINNMPAHNHDLNTTVRTQVKLSLPANNNEGDSDVPGSDKILAKMSKGLSTVNGYTSAAPDTQLKAASTSADIPIAAPTQAVGASQPVSILQPCLTVNFIIALQGVFPSRS